MSESVRIPSLRSLAPWLVLIAILAVTLIQLRRQGLLWWCACGQLSPWISDTLSKHNSQHLFDPYSFTHVLHGVILYWLLVWICPRVPTTWRLVLAVGVEAVFEVIENSAFVIQRYRAATASLEYEGDTIANSFCDILCYTGGFLLAQRLGGRGSLVLFAVTEVVLLLWIRDSLLLNVLMLIFPIDAVKAWQLSR